MSMRTYLVGIADHRKHATIDEIVLVVVANFVVN